MELFQRTLSCPPAEAVLLLRAADSLTERATAVLDLATTRKATSIVGRG
jgi:hypothetical protein